MRIGRFLSIAALGGVLAAAASQAPAAEVKVLTAGAFRQVVVALVPEFEKLTGHKVIIQNDTVGGLTRRIEGGEPFDVAIVTPAAADNLVKKGRLAAGSAVRVARVGIGVMVKAGTTKPDISTLDAFKKAVLGAKTVAYIDPASGGSSGIYLHQLFEKLGLAEQVKAKARLKKGGYVADMIVSGEAELGIHQISEILPVAGVTLVGPLPAEIQNYTVYSAAIGVGTKEREAAQALIQVLSGASAAKVLKSRGMDRPPAS